MTTHQLMLGATPSSAPPPSPADPYFENVTMLLHGDGTNGAQNNTFIDSSTNNISITRNGNTTQGSFSPFGENWSNYFDGNGDFLSRAFTSTTDGMYLQGTTYTVEAFIYVTATGGGRIYGVDAANVAQYGIFYLDINASLQPACSVRPTTGGTQVTITGSTAINLNTWYHIAISVSAGAAKLFVDGVQQASGTFAAMSFTPVGASIGNSYNGFANQYFDGYISNFRITQGTALYTSNFTPSTIPLVPISKTTLLTCQSSRFIDSSPNNFTLTANGNSAIQRFSPFSPTTLPTPYYSGWFNGDGNYLSIPPSAFAAVSADFTIEGWFNAIDAGRSADASKVGAFISGYLTASTVNSWGVMLTISGGVITTINFLTTDVVRVGATGQSISLNAWHHLAVVRSGTTVTIYVDGTSVASGTYSSTFTTNTSGTIQIARSAYGGTYQNWLKGTVSNVRLVNGSAVYTSNFTPSTSPLTSVTNTTLLTCQNATFIDNGPSALTITTVGTAQPKQISPFTLSYSTEQAYSTSVIGGSACFDGAGDFLYTPQNSAQISTTGSFTVEAWVYPMSTSDCGIFYLLGSSTYAGIRLGYIGYFYLLHSSNGTTWAVNSGSLGTAPINQWYHVALVRNGNSGKVFINGVSVYSFTWSTLYAGANNLIGAYILNTSYYTMNGYMSNARIINGTALYNNNFAPPNAPQTAITNTSLLCNFTNAGIFDNAEMNDLETVGNAQISTSVVKFGTGSLAFDGTGDVLKMPITPQFYLGTTYTIEMWIYPAVTTNYHLAFGLMETNVTGFTSLEIGRDGTSVRASVRTVTSGATTSISGGTVVANTWYHLALSVNAGSARLFLNGTQVGSTTTFAEYPIAKTLFASVGGFGNGFTSAGFKEWQGNLDDVRITKGYARYTANFTPPTAAFPNY